jgi:hypothetical protein
MFPNHHSLPPLGSFGFGWSKSLLGSGLNPTAKTHIPWLRLGEYRQLETIDFRDTTGKFSFKNDTFQVSKIKLQTPTVKWVWTSTRFIC